MSNDLTILFDDYRDENHGLVSKKNLALYRAVLSTSFLVPSYFHISSSFLGAELKGYRCSILMSATSCLFSLLSITKRASGTAFTSRPIPKLTRSKNSKLMKCNLRHYPDNFRCVLRCFPCTYRSNLTLCVANNYLQLSVRTYCVPTSNMKYLPLSPDDHSIQRRMISFSIQC